MISIAIPARNEEYHIGRLLGSLAMQDIDEDIEVIIADAASEDRTREVSASFSKHFKRFAIVEGGRPAAGRNSAARMSTGDPIVFIDADVVLPRSYLRTCVSRFRDRNLAIAASPLMPQSTRFVDSCFGYLNNASFYASKFFNPSGAMCVMASRLTFELSGGYPQDVYMNEDHDFVRACAAFGKYDLLPVAARYSVRRFEKEGRMQLMFKYAKVSAYRAFVGPVRTPVVEYDFNYTRAEDRA